MDELLLEWSRGEQAVKIGSEELGDEVAIVPTSAHTTLLGLKMTHMSSRGEMKMSLNEMI